MPTIFFYWPSQNTRCLKSKTQENTNKSFETSGSLKPMYLFFVFQ